MEENISFKTVLFGFDREQVLNCIDEQIKKNLELEKENQENRNNLVQTQMEADRLNRENDELHARVETLRASAAEMDARNEETLREKESLNESLIKSQAETREFKERLFNREQEFINLKKTRYTLEEENKALQDKLAAAEAAHAAEMEEKCRELMAALQEEKQKNEQAAADLAAAEAQNEQTAAAVQALKEENARMAEELAELREKAAETPEIPEEFEARVAEAEQCAADAEARLEKMRDEMEIRLNEAHHNAFEKTMAESRLLRQDAKVLSEGIASLRLRLNEVDVQMIHAVNELQATTADINVVLDSAEAEAKGLTDRLNRIADLQADDRTVPQGAAAEKPAEAPMATKPEEQQELPKAQPVRPVVRPKTAQPAQRVSVTTKSLLDRLNHLLGE